jgi:hypothetical protein
VDSSKKEVEKGIMKLTFRLSIEKDSSGSIAFMCLDYTDCSKRCEKNYVNGDFYYKGDSGTDRAYFRLLDS